MYLCIDEGASGIAFVVCFFILLLSYPLHLSCPTIHPLKQARQTDSIVSVILEKIVVSVKGFGKTAMAKMLLMLFLFSMVYLLIDTVTAYRAPTEEERVQLWHEDNNVRKITNPNPITNFCHQIDISNKISHKIPSRIMFHLYYLLYHFSYHQSSLLSGMATELATRIRWNQRIVCTTRERNHGNSWWE